MKDAVPFRLVQQLLECFDLDANKHHIARMEINHLSITVTRYLTNEDGKVIAQNGVAATEVITLPLQTWEAYLKETYGNAT